MEKKLGQDKRIDIEDTLGNDLFKVDFSLKESIGALNRIVDEVNLSIKGVKDNQQLTTVIYR